MIEKVTTDYTAEANQDTQLPGGTQGYRLLHWMKDILKNFMSDPVNIKDERLCKLLRLQDDMDDERMDAMFKVGVPYTNDMRKAGTTPAIIVSIGDTKYPINHLNTLPSGVIASGGARAAFKNVKYKAIGMFVSIATESYDGTLLLGNIIEDFLIVNELLLKADNPSVSEFHVTGVSGIEALEEGQTGNAKKIYQMTISISTGGGISWTTDTQGPTFRGIRTSTQQL